MNLSAVVNQLVSLFLMMLVGYLSARAGVVTPEFRKRLSSFTLTTAAPCIIISSVLESESSSATMLSAVGVAVLFFLLMIVFAAVLVRLVRTKPDERGLDQMMLIFTNVGFMGIPVVQSIYGPDGVARLSMFILIFNIVFFSYGVLLITRGAKFSLKSMLNSCIIAALIGLLFGVTGWHLPAPIEDTLSAIGAMNTPLAMIIIGASVAHSDLRAALTNPRLYRVCLLSMLVMPLLTLLVMLPLPFDRMLVGISVLLAGMPIAGNCGMICDIYRPNDLTASHAVMVSTLMSGVTLPLLCALLAAVL
ncbi:MAG: AEC family transporter [Christensenellales bacterium]|nr:AEC family transporter [Christensenellales bacterium]